MRGPLLIALLLLVALAAPGCGTFVVRSSEGLELSPAEALEVAKSLEHGRGVAYRGPHVGRVTAEGVELAHWTGVRGPDYTPYAPYRYDRREMVPWSRIRRVTVRPHILLDVMSWFTLLFFLPNWYWIEFEDAQGKVIFGYLLWGQFLRNTVPAWLVLSNRNYCRNVARAVLLLSEQSPGPIGR